MSEIKYSVVQYSPGQKCFGAGQWVVQRTTTEDILAAPSKGAADALVRKLKRADKIEDDED